MYGKSWFSFDPQKGFYGVILWPASACTVGNGRAQAC